MRRPMLIFGFVFAFFLFLTGFYGKAAAAVALPVAVAGLCVTTAIKSTRSTRVFPTAFLAVALACTVFLCAERFKYAPALDACAQEQSVKGVLIDIPQERDGKIFYTIKTSEIVGKPVKTKLVFSSRIKLDVDFYDTITLERATVYAAEEASAGQLLFYKSEGVFLRAYSFYSASVSHAEKRPLAYYVPALRRALCEKILSVLPGDEGAISVAMLLGVRDYVSDELYSAYKSCGVVHLLAVSGLHTSLWSMLIYRFLLTLFKRRRLSAAVSAVFLVFFAALTGFSPSVCRASIMLGTVYVGELFRREADALNSLGLSLTAIALFNPYSVMGLSLMLSALSTAGILVASSRFYHRASPEGGITKYAPVRAAVNYIKETLVMTGAATVFTLPVLILFIGRISVASPVVNTAVLYLASKAMLFGGVAAVLAPLSFISRPLFLVCGLLIKLVNQTTIFFASLPLASIPVNYTYIKIWLALTMLAVAAVILKKRSKVTMRICALSSVFVLLLSSCLFYTVSGSKVKLCVTDVGNGTAVMLKKGMHTALIGCGGDYFAAGNIRAQLEESYAKTDLIIVPRNEPTEASAYVELSATLKAEKTFVSSDFYITLLHSGDEIAADYASVRLWDAADIEYINSDSLSAAYVMINGCGVTVSFRPANDVSLMPEKWRNAAVLICRQALPVNAGAYGFSAVIISGDGEKGLLSYKGCLETGFDEVYLTAEHGDISLTGFSEEALKISAGGGFNAVF
ncbi:MAG: ComEC/Rec2 family competence protein [Clostridiales bacterium]|nr:ComEC/Rec2 family competence protein [Clostridiales bacterium]